MKAALLRALVWLGGISRDLADLLMPLFRDSLARTLSALAPITVEVVSDLATRSDISGREKRRLAVERITALAVAEGIAFTTRAIHLAIELAVAKLNVQKS